MTAPRRVSDIAPPQGGDGERLDFTAKKDLAEIPLIVTGFRTANGSNGAFNIVEATRQDSGDVVNFTGATAVDKQLTTIKDANAFPVLAMLKLVSGATNPYWMLVDPPGTEAPRTPSRIAEVGAFVDKGLVTVERVGELCAEIAGKPTKVNDLSDQQYATLLNELRALGLSADEPPPLEEPF